jgi:hypothetical protein
MTTDRISEFDEISDLMFRARLAQSQITQYN